MQLLPCCHLEHCFKFRSLQQSSSLEWWREFSFEFALQGQPACLKKKEKLLAEMGLFSASLHYFLISSWGKHLAVDLCMGQTFSSWQQDFQLLAIQNSYSYSDEFCSKRCSLIWTIQIKVDGAQSDAFLPADVIRVDFLDFYLFVVTSQTWSWWFTDVNVWNHFQYSCPVIVKAHTWAGTTHVTQDRRGHPGYRAVQLCLTCH